MCCTLKSQTQDSTELIEKAVSKATVLFNCIVHPQVNIRILMISKDFSYGCGKSEATVQTAVCPRIGWEPAWPLALDKSAQMLMRGQCIGTRLLELDTLLLCLSWRTSFCCPLLKDPRSSLTHLICVCIYTEVLKIDASSYCRNINRLVGSSGNKCKSRSLWHII